MLEKLLEQLFCLTWSSFTVSVVEANIPEIVIEVGQHKLQSAVLESEPTGNKTCSVSSKIVIFLQTI